MIRSAGRPGLDPGSQVKNKTLKHFDKLSARQV